MSNANKTNSLTSIKTEINKLL